VSILDNIFGHGHGPKAEPDYVAVGEQPATGVGQRMAADARAASSTELAAQAAQAANLHEVNTRPEPPTVRQVRVGNEEWAAETFVMRPGEVVEIVGREGTRDTFDIVNQSSALNDTATEVTIALCRERRDADRLANGQQPFKSTGRHVYLPDGASRTLTHTAPMYAVADPGAAAAAFAFIDVSIEYGERYRQPYGHHTAPR
jgi:hypothetical protein